MGAGAGLGYDARLSEDIHTSHENLIIGCRIMEEGLKDVVYGKVLYQKTFGWALKCAAGRAAAVGLHGWLAGLVRDCRRPLGH